MRFHDLRLKRLEAEYTNVASNRGHIMLEVSTTDLALLTAAQNAALDVDRDSRTIEIHLTCIPEGVYEALLDFAKEHLGVVLEESV